MEFVADYDMQILYHVGKANVVADALSRRKVDVDIEKELQNLETEFKMISSATLEGEEGEPFGLQAVSQAGLLARNQECQIRDVNLIREQLIGGNFGGYQVASDGTLLFNGRVTVPKAEGLREEILRTAHHSLLSIPLARNEERCSNVGFSVSGLPTNKGRTSSSKWLTLKSTNP